MRFFAAINHAAFTKNDIGSRFDSAGQTGPPGFS